MSCIYYVNPFKCGDILLNGIGLYVILTRIVGLQKNMENIFNKVKEQKSELMPSFEFKKASVNDLDYIVKLEKYSEIISLEKKRSLSDGVFKDRKEYFRMLLDSKDYDVFLLCDSREKESYGVMIVHKYYVPDSNLIRVGDSYSLSKSIDDVSLIDQDTLNELVNNSNFEGHAARIVFFSLNPNVRDKNALGDIMYKVEHDLQSQGYEYLLFDTAINNNAMQRCSFGYTFIPVSDLGVKDVLPKEWLLAVKDIDIKGGLKKLIDLVENSFDSQMPAPYQFPVMPEQWIGNAEIPSDMELFSKMQKIETMSGLSRFTYQPDYSDEIKEYYHPHFLTISGKIFEADSFAGEGGFGYCIRYKSHHDNSVIVVKFIKKSDNHVTDPALVEAKTCYFLSKISNVKKWVPDFIAFQPYKILMDKFTKCTEEESFDGVMLLMEDAGEDFLLELFRRVDPIIIDSLYDYGYADDFEDGLLLFFDQLSRKQKLAVIDNVIHSSAWDFLINSVDQLCGAYCELHRAGLIHGDINPRNFLYKGTPKIIDLGSVTHGGHKNSKEGNREYLLRILNGKFPVYRHNPIYSDPSTINSRDLPTEDMTTKHDFLLRLNRYWYQDVCSLSHVVFDFISKLFFRKGLFPFMERINGRTVYDGDSFIIKFRQMEEALDEEGNNLIPSRILDAFRPPTSIEERFSDENVIGEFTVVEMQRVRPLMVDFKREVIAWLQNLTSERIMRLLEVLDSIY